jgi:hypothetical protein
VIPSLHQALLPKNIGNSVTQSTPSKPSTSRASKKVFASSSTTAKAPKRKPTLTKGGQGSFTVLGAPTSKVDYKLNEQ